jgi:Uma2 family endonuclease
MWVDQELEDYLHLPDDGSRVEIINGEITVSPAPEYAHNGPIGDVQGAFYIARHLSPAFSWRAVQTTGLNLIEIQDGYIPDLLVVSMQVHAEALRTHARYLVPEQVTMTVEATSKSNAASDREPAPASSRRTKWNGYAATGIPYYLLIDRDPKVAQAILHSSPDRSTGRYEDQRAWNFGDTIHLAAPFDVDIVTSDWQPWNE